MRKSIDWFLYEGNTGIYWIKILRINPSRLDAGRREEINLNFIFTLPCRASKVFYEGLKGLHKAFWGTTNKRENENLS